MASPNHIVPTPPAGDSSKRTANTEFVTNALGSAISSLPVIPSTTQTDFISGGVAAPAVQEYRIVEYVPFPVTLGLVVEKLSTGTISSYLKINSATVTGSNIGALGTTQISSLLTAANTATTGDVIVFGISATASSPANLSFMVRFTRSFS